MIERESELSIIHVIVNLFNVCNQMYPLDLIVLPEAKTCVFWDVEDCLISENIKSALEEKGYNRRNVSIRVYGEMNKSMHDANIIFFPTGENSSLIKKPSFFNFFTQTSIDNNNMVSGDKYARLLTMVKDLYLWVLDNPESNLMVISEDKV